MNPARQAREVPTGWTRRRFLRLGSAGLLSAGLSPFLARAENAPSGTDGETVTPEYLTREENFKNVGRGKPPPHELSEAKRREVGLVPETWRLEVVADPESDSKLDHPLSKAQGTALTWAVLMKLAETHTVRFLHVMACTNMPGPLGLGLWEGVPLREVIWMARPTANVRRLFYHGYHNDDPKQRFQSSLTLDRVLEDPPGEWPVILCYKLNGQWLTPQRGGPVRMVVPGLYANKSVKWLQRVVLTNNPRLNDTYAEWNNDTESQLKTCASFLSVPEKASAGRPLPIAGVAQVGMSGLRGVQYFLQPKDQAWPQDDPSFGKVPWHDAQLLPPPAQWGGGLTADRLTGGVLGFSASTNKPLQWPMRDSLVHWRAVLTDLAPGRYELLCRSIDANGLAQPLPRPLLKSGHNAIQRLAVTVESVGSGKAGNLKR
jgi:DMSO/TMAO reductase YedYZ molybdopterin-dependent catalytic subunit